MLLANPLEETERVKTFTSLMRKISPEMSTGWLRELRLSGEIDLVTEISLVLLASLAPLVEKKNSQSRLVTCQPDEALKETLELQHLAELYRLSGQVEEAEELFQQVQQASKAWLAGINIQLTDLAFQLDQSELANSTIDQMKGFTSDQIDATAELVLSLGQPWQSKFISERGLSDSQHPLMTILHAEEIGKAGDLSTGQELAKEAVQLWLSGLEEIPSGHTPHYAVDWQPEIFAYALLNLRLDEEAIEFTEAALRLKPANEVLMDLLVSLWQKQGNIEAALDLVGVLASLNQNVADRQRNLAKLLNVTGRWPEAYATWKRTLHLTRTPQLDDWLGMAEASLEVNDLPQTIEMCGKVLELDANHGMANSMLGRALVETGQFKEAIPVLVIATANSPEETRTWLELANAYRNLGENHRVLETLRAAALAVSNSAEIYLALGETCLEAGLQSESLPAFRKAAQIRPDSARATVQLANSLFSLGHLSEAQTVLMDAIQRWPEDPEVAYVYAKVSLALGDQETALHVLEIAIQTEKPEIERYLLLAETLLDGFTPGSVKMVEKYGNHLERAGQVLEAALTWMPENWMGLILQGELLLARNENQAAYDLYSHLYETNPCSNSDHYWRLLAGLGLSAMRVGQVDMALSALQDAILNQPENLGLHRLLAEANLQANQRQDAIQRARLALKLATNDMENLLWYADLMSRMEETPDAVIAMQVVTQLAPERPEFWLKRAGLEVEIGDLVAAQQSLQTMLGLTEIKHDHYRLAALTFLRMQDQTAAMACLDLALGKSEEISTNMLLEMTCLNFRLGRLEMALESLQKLTGTLPNDGILQVLQADLLCGLERWQQALSSLDRALEIWEKGHRTGEIGRWQRIVSSGWMREEWLTSANRLGMISFRKALIYQRMNEIDLSEQHADLTLQQLEKFLPAVILAVELAMERHDLDRSETLLQEAEISNPNLAGLQVELAQAQGKIDLASELLRKVMIDHPHDFRLRILQVSRLSRRFDWAAANSLFDRLLTDCKGKKTTPNRWPVGEAEILNSLILRGDLQRLVNVALELRRWQDATNLVAEYVRIYGDAAAFLHQAKVLVICAEQQKLYEELNITTHAPGIDMISIEKSQQFETAMEKAGCQSYQHENQRWLKRGRVAYQGTADQISDLANLADNLEDFVAVMGSLRRNQNNLSVIEMAGQYPQEPLALAELALAQMSVDAKDAQLTAQHLAEINPSDPVHLTILALIATRNEDWTIALGALENALQIWPEEAEWHAWAADIASRVNADRACQAHWEQAVMLQPKRVGYALALGRTYNNRQVFDKAASVLKRASEITDQHPEVWLELARSLQGTGEYGEALECAGKAAELLPDNSQPLLLSGEISVSMGKLDWALAYAQEAYKIASREEKVIIFLARVMEKRGKPADGLALIQKSLVNLEQCDDLVFEEARLLRKIHGPKAALSVLSRLVNQKPDLIEALSLVAQVQADCGDLIAAEETARKALGVNPEDPETNLLLGSLLHKSGQLDQAVVYLKLATLGGDHNLEALMELGRVYQARREFQLAMQIYQQAILMAPKDHRSFLAAGTVLREAKDYRGSEAMFRRAAELAPDDVNIQRQLGAVVALNLVYESQEVKFSYGQH